MSNSSLQSIVEGNFKFSNVSFRTDIAFALGLVTVLVLLILRKVFQDILLQLLLLAYLFMELEKLLKCKII